MVAISTWAKERVVWLCWALELVRRCCEVEIVCAQLKLKPQYNSNDGISIEEIRE